MRDMDIAAELIGIRPLYAKLSAFAVSSFYRRRGRARCGPSSISAPGSRWLRSNRSFQLLFMVIIGGLGSILGSFLGAAFIVLLPILLNQVPHVARHPALDRDISHIWSS